MKNRFRRKKPGLPPGSVIFTGEKKVEDIKMHHLVYNDDHLTDDTHETESIGNQLSVDKGKVNWFDIRGLHDTTLIEKVGHAFGIHNLVLEDIADTNQRPKFDEYDNGVFVVIKALHYHKDKTKMHTEQVAIFFRDNLIVTFQEDEADLLKAVRERVKNKSGRIRQRGADYLCYAIMDALVDQYFLVLDQMENDIESIESGMIEGVDTGVRAGIHRLKKEVVVMRKSIAPLREVMGKFSKSDTPFIADSTTLFIRDLYDHTIQVMDMVDTYRDMLNGLQDLYISEISLKMNQVMQVLTIITTVFVPLSFLAGLYGMNFKYIPELEYRYGYFVLLGLMFLIFIGALMYFRNKKWL